MFPLQRPSLTTLITTNYMIIIIIIITSEGKKEKLSIQTCHWVCHTSRLPCNDWTVNKLSKIKSMVSKPLSQGLGSLE